MNKIVRTKSRAEGGLTPEEEKRMAEHAQLWIKRAFRTDPIEPDKIIPAIEGLYAAAGLKTPRVVIVPSPLVMAFSYGAATAIWRERKNVSDDGILRAADDIFRAAYGATYNATFDTTYRATRRATDMPTRHATYDAADIAAISSPHDATYSATYSAADNAAANTTYNAVYDAMDDDTFHDIDHATYSATYGATYNATRRATHNAADSVTYDATYNTTVRDTDRATYNTAANTTYNAVYDATEEAADAIEKSAATACHFLAGDLGIKCANRWSGVYQGGNMWAPAAAYLSAARDILGLELDEHKNYAHWEQAAIHGGFRVMHEEFCIVSDFPEIMKSDDNNQPHCEDGPSHRWRDGWSLYHWHGVKVPAHWIEDKENLDPNEILKVDNVEQRAAGCQIIGWAKMLDHLDHKIIDSDPDPEHGDLIEVTLDGLPEPEWYLRFYCPRNGLMMEGVNKHELKEPTVFAAQAWKSPLPDHLFSYPKTRS